MNVRVATYNVNNLFRRARLMQLEGFSAAAREVLNDLMQLNELLERPAYDAAIKTKIKALLEKYQFHRRTEKPWFTINEVKSRLFKIKKSPASVEVIAKGRGDWQGWIELVREGVGSASTENTARVIQAVKPHVLCLVEVEDRITLDRFNSQVLKKFNTAFSHNLLVDGNDPRGIDLGLMSQFDIRSVRSHIDDSFVASNGQTYPIFSRDCPEYEIVLPSGRSAWILCNHFKSKGYGSPADNDAKRRRQADQVRKILARFNLSKDFVVVAGDFNDTPDRPPLAGLLHIPNLIDVLASPLLNGPRWTYQSGKDQFDYLLVSKALFARLKAVGIERQGIFHPTSFGGKFPHFPEVNDKTNHASDHAAVWAEFKL